MSRALRVLVVEDYEPDAEMVVRELGRCGFVVTWERVDTSAQLSDALERAPWDLIISDYRLPAFSAPAALELVKARGLDVPFIIVSGTVGEETAVEAIRAGAHDFMVKGRFARLGSAVERELRDVGLRAERMKMQEQLLISERMVSVGTLAAGLAHEINNPLAVVMANVECALRDLNAWLPAARAAHDEAGRRALDERTVSWFGGRVTDVQESLADARLAADRVRLLVRDLKIFSRPDETRPGPVDVHQVIETAVRMAHNEIRHRAAYVKAFGANVPCVEGVEARLGQVFLNLVVNAAQAMPEGRVSTNELRISTSVDGDGNVVVEVRDTGTGIPEVLRSRIFDPFFTTKPVGVGTGLGLSICHRLVTSMGGQIHIASEVGRGTSVRVVLPAAAEHEPPSPEVAPVTSRTPLRLLVVDDDVSLGTALRRSLSQEHHVIVVNDADTALTVLRQSAAFDAIVCDLMMPQMTGMDFYRALQATAPELAKKVVFMTAGAFTQTASDFLARVDNPRLEKPFTPAHLVRVLRQRVVTSAP